jgi:hypothetical protein
MENVKNLQDPSTKLMENYPLQEPLKESKKLLENTQFPSLSTPVIGIYTQLVCSTTVD